MSVSKWEKASLNWRYEEQHKRLGVGPDATPVMDEPRIWKAWMGRGQEGQLPVPTRPILHPRQKGWEKDRPIAHHVLNAHKQAAWHPDVLSLEPVVYNDDSGLLHFVIAV
jgi:hypothetical protein